MDIEKPVAYLLENNVQHYDWGGTDAIPALLDLDNPEKKPFAELWMGAHPNSSSIAVNVQEGGESQELRWLISENLDAMLGGAVAQKFGQLPYLFKILSAGSALSIQVHPDKLRAEEGFALENKKGIPLTAFNRNYKDDNHKPEIFCALVPCWVMRGFRIPSAVSELIKKTQSQKLMELATVLEDSSLTEWDQLKGFFLSLINLNKEAATALIDEVLFAIDPETNTVFQWVHRLAEYYPGDVGVLAPLYLNLIHLLPGEALYLGAGVLHAYLEGTGVELMANSDNVLRGGLTPKYMDPKELTAIVQFIAESPEILHPVLVGEELVYETPSDEFLLSKVILEGQAHLGAPVSPSILICLKGGGRVGDLSIKKGESLFIPWHKKSVTLLGEGIFYRASVPL